MHIEPVSLWLPCVLLGTANVYVLAQAIDGPGKATLQVTGLDDFRDSPPKRVTIGYLPEEFEFGSEMTNSMNHEIGVPLWVHHEVHSESSADMDSTEDNGHPVDSTAKPHVEPPPKTSTKSDSLEETNPSTSSTPDDLPPPQQSNEKSDSPVDDSTTPAGQDVSSGEHINLSENVQKPDGGAPHISDDRSDRDETVVIHKTPNGQYEVEKTNNPSHPSKHSGVGWLSGSSALTLGFAFLALAGGRFRMSGLYQ
ncbi:hypothetical protein BIW11_05330 [Tropilaelaps mercedesae]|uniref:Uncharacterized protein n=1 Tax=Tropilaelaps mercedesae TaxID=418985 RepID=A0A1V9Y2V8_9ACAR|nr:hypothetical protein BIW11_05330 [Tropilaelaps mercedesae]